jgi:hypothetical protein
MRRCRVRPEKSHKKILLITVRKFLIKASKLPETLSPSLSHCPNQTELTFYQFLRYLHLHTNKDMNRDTGPINDLSHMVVTACYGKISIFEKSEFVSLDILSEADESKQFCETNKKRCSCIYNK